MAKRTVYYDAIISYSAEYDDSKETAEEAAERDWDNRKEFMGVPATIKIFDDEETE